MLQLPAWWVPIILYSDISNSQQQKHGEALLNDENDPNNLDCLSQLMGLQYSQLYIPFMQHCGLITMKNRWGRTSPILCITMENKLGSAYSWEDFLPSIGCTRKFHSWHILLIIMERNSIIFM